LEYQEVLEKYIKEDKPFMAFTKSSIISILVDQGLRWVLLLLYKNSIVDYFFFIIGQAAIITTITFVFIYFRNRYIRKKITERLNLSMLSIIPSKESIMTVIIITVLGWLAIDNVLYGLNLQSWGSKFGIQVLITLIYLIYIFVITFLLSPSQRIHEIIFHPEHSASYYCLPTDKLEEINEKGIKEDRTDDIDVNDIRLTQLETNLINVTGRTETYTVESVFLGALTFSGFLSIISSDKVQENISVLKEIGKEVGDLIFDLYILNFNAASIKVNLIMDGYSLFAIVAVEALICSIIFLLVLASRIRLAEFLDKTKQLLNIAKLYNAKEEELYLLKCQGVKDLDERRIHLKTKIDRALLDSESAYRKVLPLFSFMSFLRNLGIYSFYFILITSGLFFSVELSISIIILIVVIGLIKFMLSWLNLNRLNKILIKHRTK
jgi:hypothetical protein